ncbi:histone-lysine N-methyltransferase SETD2 isoform X2 [Periplaneta americana]|uniref:histone-lysine N-methyltransferase SETD2 isoform X2 n=1 Tax=Periplaneta americana TaxID=6978 RepID=UPI0037E7983F
MVIRTVQVMARRRKGAGGSKAATKSQAKASRKSNGVTEDRVNGSLMPPSTNESEESCVSQEDTATPLSCHTPVEMCPADPSLGEPPPLTAFKINSSPQHIPLVHKKFRKFRRMLESGDVQEPQQNCLSSVEKMDPSETQIQPVLETQDEMGELVIDQQEMAQEVPVVWEAEVEVAEETVVCEGMEMDDTRSQDNLLVEEVASQESDYDHMIEVRDSEFSNQNAQVIVVREDGFNNHFSQEIMDVSGMGEVLSHRIVEFNNTQDAGKEIGHGLREVIAVGCEDSEGTVRGVEECSQDTQGSIRGMELEMQEDEELLKPAISENLMGIIKSVDSEHQAMILQVPNNQVTDIKHEIGDENHKNLELISFVEEGNEDNKPLFNDIEIKMGENAVLKDNKCYVGYNDMALVNVRTRNYQTDVGLQLNEMGGLGLGMEFADKESRIIMEEKSLQKALDNVKLEPVVKTAEDEKKFQAEEDSLSHMQEVSYDQQLNARSNEDEVERKQVAAFRSRSGSTDTTGSESSSNCSSGVRRSNRIRSIGIMKQRAQNKCETVDTTVTSCEKESGDNKACEGRDSSDCCSGTDTQSDKENIIVTKVSAPTISPATLHGLITPAIPGYDVDSCKPVKVKSRWRRSSELEMGGSRSSDSELAATPPTPSLSPRPMVPVPLSLSPRPGAPATPNPSIRPVIPAAIQNTVLPLEQASVAEAKKDARSEKKEREDREMEERLRNFEILTENEYLTERTTSKEAKRMVCDCFLTKDEIVRGELGCGEDCLNRLLMIECGSRCPVGDRCTNRRFQKQDYAKCEIFKTEKKGFGLKALQELPMGTFVMEYVGEVLDPKEFRRRAKDYAKDKNRHYYFMALKSDAIIDATVKGNISRFINHSCEPNAETQKWTVNGELRIGFFSKRSIAAGEEITFDYQFQRYGKEAQRCHCESSVCRGWIGEDPEKEKRDRKERKERELKKKREEKRNVKEFLEDMDLEEEIEKLCVSGLKNRAHTLTLCRLMVRAEDLQSRAQLLKLLQCGEPACRRLFLDYHGLRLIWSWMMDVGLDKTNDGLGLRMEILQTLSKLPIPNKTVLQDSKVMAVVEKWALLPANDGAPDSLLADGSSDGTDDRNTPRLEAVRKERSSVEEESGSDPDVGKPRSDAVLPVILEVPDEETLQGVENEKQLVDSTSDKQTDLLPDEVVGQVVSRGSDSDEEASSEVVDKIRATEEDSDAKDRGVSVSESEGADKTRTFLDLASSLLGEWTSLKEVFRIPKKERIEQMKEHEREADRGYKEYLDKEHHHEKQSYDRHWRQDRFRSDYDKRDRDRKRMRESPDADRIRKGSRFDDRNIVPIPRLSKQERRQLFAMKVAQEEEEERQRRQQQEMWRHHQDRCLALGLDPVLTAAFDPQTGYPCFFDPASGTWQAYPPQEQNPLPSSGMTTEIVPSPMFNPNNPVSPHLPGMPPPQGVPSHVIPGGLPPGSYDPNNPHVPHQPMPFDPGNHQVSGIPAHQHHPTYSDPRPGSGPIDPTLTEFIPLPSGPQPPPIYQHQHLYTTAPTPGPGTAPSGVPVESQPHYHHMPIQQPFVPAPPPPIQLPPKWKSAKDSEGRTYYYHVKTRISQWEPPQWTENEQQPESETSSESSDDDDDDEEDESSTTEEEEEEGEQEEKTEEDEDEEDEDEVVEEKDEVEEEEAKEVATVSSVPVVVEEEMELLQEEIDPSKVQQEEPKKKEKRREGLVQERIISPRREEDRQDMKKYREIKEKLRRKKEQSRSRERSDRLKKRHRDGKQRSSSKSTEKPVTVAADTSSDAARKIKDQFRLHMAGVIVQYLNPYRKPDCKTGRITNTEDFKHLARKLTHFVMLKELKHCRSVEDLECNDNVKHKARDFIKKYMAKFGTVYQRPKDDD